MMFGFGDVANPLPQSTQLMEDLVTDYVQQILHKASAVSEERHRQLKRGTESLRVRERDLLFVLRKDQKRYNRVNELLKAWEEQKEARREGGDKTPAEYEKEDKDRPRGD